MLPRTSDSVIDAVARDAPTVVPPGQERVETHGGKPLRCPSADVALRGLLIGPRRARCRR
jgi:hypothetical protein